MSLHWTNFKKNTNPTNLTVRSCVCNAELLFQLDFGKFPNVMSTNKAYEDVILHQPWVNLRSVLVLKYVQTIYETATNFVNSFLLRYCLSSSHKCIITRGYCTISGYDLTTFRQCTDLTYALYLIQDTIVSSKGLVNFSRIDTVRFHVLN